MVFFPLRGEPLKTSAMTSINYSDWNRIIYYVSNVYRETLRLKPGDASFLGERICHAAVSISVKMNCISPGSHPESIYPILSSVSVLETYLQLAKEYGILKNVPALESELEEIRDTLCRLVEKED